MPSQLSQQKPDAELQEAFRQHLPQRLRTLLRRARAQCRTGWDCNVLHSLHDEIAQLDNDPNWPEHGKLEIDLCGGR